MRGLHLAGPVVNLRRRLRRVGAEARGKTTRRVRVPSRSACVATGTASHGGLRRQASPWNSGEPPAPCAHHELRGTAPDPNCTARQGPAAGAGAHRHARRAGASPPGTAPPRHGVPSGRALAADATSNGWPVRPTRPTLAGPPTGARRAGQRSRDRKPARDGGEHVGERVVREDSAPRHSLGGGPAY
jgi:hypothetical protein